MFCRSKTCWSCAFMQQASFGLANWSNGMGTPFFCNTGERTDELLHWFCKRLKVCNATPGVPVVEVLAHEAL